MLSLDFLPSVAHSANAKSDIVACYQLISGVYFVGRIVSSETVQNSIILKLILHKCNCHPILQYLIGILIQQIIIKWEIQLYSQPNALSQLQDICLMVTLSFFLTLNRNPELPTCPFAFLSFSSLLLIPGSQFYNTGISYTPQQFLFILFGQDKRISFHPWFFSIENQHYKPLTYHSITLKYSVIIYQRLGA